jgi:hypothetical protein
MPELISNTYGMIVTGAGATAANAETVIGTIELPASDGDWTIWGVYCQNVPATLTAAEAAGGNFRFNTPQGNLDPQPNPSRFPTSYHGSFLGAVADVVLAPLKIYRTNYKGAGKANIQAIFNEDSAVTVAEQVVMGILFGKTAPVMPDIMFTDFITTTITGSAAAQIGTFNLPQKAKRIVGLACIIVQDGVLTTAEELIGFWSLESQDIKLDPLQLPVNCCFSAGLGATIANPSQPRVEYIPVDIPADGGIDIDAFIDLNTAVTNAARVIAFIAYEL